ncbi:MAG: hypothetical protein HRU76_06500 [Phycisphaeraceae bacterium]|nr:hypothetical protein [Phycisphaerales bacterium]QOJ17242.1 MAG: hypothetical protein HRU76_06500 [Phycisphaeraceae bacterium]
MVRIESSGDVTFELHDPGARQVLLVGAFDSWHEQRLPMRRDERGTWRLTVQAGPGCHLFRYLIDGRRWRLDEAAHGVHRTADGQVKSRCWRPPLTQDPDAIAA